MRYATAKNISDYVNRISDGSSKYRSVVMPGQKTRSRQVVRIANAIGASLCNTDGLYNEHKLERAMIRLLLSTINHAVIVDRLTAEEILTILNTDFTLPQDAVVVNFSILTDLTNLERGDVAGTFEICMMVLKCVTNDTTTFIDHIGAVLSIE